MGTDAFVGTSVIGDVVAGEFIDRKGDGYCPTCGEERAPGTYVTIRLRDERAALVGGPVQITYLPRTEETPNAPPTSD